MRIATFLLIVIVIIPCCKKASDSITTDDFNYYAIQKTLKDSMNPNEFSKLDWTKATSTLFPAQEKILFRIPLTGHEFRLVYLMISNKHNFAPPEGRIVHLQGHAKNQQTFNGSIQVESLSGKDLSSSKVENGFLIQNMSSGDDVNFQKMEPGKSIVPRPPEYQELPEVIVVNTPRSQGNDFSTWIYFPGIFNANTSNEYYVYAGGGGGTGTSSESDTQGEFFHHSGGNHSNNSAASNYPIIDPISVDYESQWSNPAIDLAKFIKCFTNLPDAGSTASIEIFSDIPVDNHPEVLFDWDNNSPGHVFIQIRKTSQGTTVQQNIGFYPLTGWKVGLTAASVPAKCVDNQDHEYNASMKVNLSPAQLVAALNKMLTLKDIRYDVDDFNCTDWALSIFNAAVPENSKLIIPRIVLPGNGNGIGSNTPQGLFSKLKILQQEGGTAAQGINIPKEAWVGASTGPCN